MLYNVVTVSRPARRAIPLLCLSMIVPVAAVCEAGEVEAAPPETAPDDGQQPRTVERPNLYMPFPAGAAHSCTQGNGETHSHNASNTKHALDFKAPSGETVVSALAGRVGYVKSDCTPGDWCGGGFGNYVKLDHGGGYYTLYAHLGQVAVTTGNEVGRGVPLGKVGKTGNITGAHLHFSLHEGDSAAKGIESTVSFTLRARDLAGGPYIDRASGDHVCADPGGNTYESDNACSMKYDALQDAKPITNETGYLGEFCRKGDVDFFSFSGGAGGFEARITSTGQSMSDCSCAILDEKGNEPPKGGVDGYIRDDDFNGSEGCACALTKASSARYYLKVFSQFPGVYVMYKQLP